MAKNTAATTTRQLRISFDAKSTLKHNLREGQFSVLVEYRVPAVENPFKLALAPGVELAKYVQSDKRLASLVISEGDGGETHDPVKTVRHLQEHCEKELIVRLQGRGNDPDKLRETLAELTSAGITSIAAATGPALPDHPRQDNGRARPHPEGYLDSTQMIRLMRASYPQLFIGAGVNPFKYTVADTYLQYFKMVKKLNTGADFIVAQAGWDMKKLHELQWHIRTRGLDEPVLARLLILRPKEVSTVLEEMPGGLVMSRALAALLQRESAINEVQSLSAQIQRIALQVAGCRLMGYSGVQLAGIGDPDTAKTVIDRLFEVLEEMTSYPAWVEAWGDFHNNVEMAPQVHSYYIFAKLLDQAHLDYDPDETPMIAQEFPEPSTWDKARCRIAAGLRLGKSGNPLQPLLARALCGSSAAGRCWRLDKTQMLCAAACPKGLEDGPCACSRTNGNCEFNDHPCFYHQVLALANWRKDLESFETANEA